MIQKMKTHNSATNQKYKFTNQKYCSIITFLALRFKLHNNRYIFSLVRWVILPNLFLR